MRRIVIPYCIFLSMLYASNTMAQDKEKMKDDKTKVKGDDSKEKYKDDKTKMKDGDSKMKMKNDGMWQGDDRFSSFR